MNNNKMQDSSVRYVIKRKGTKEEIQLEKIQNRIKYLINEPYKLHGIDIFKLVVHVINELNDGIKTSDIDTYTAELSASLASHHLDYLTLAGRIAINNHHKKTLKSFRDKMEKLYMRKDVHGIICPIINDNFYKFVKKNQNKIDKYINYERDYDIDYFGFNTLEEGYLLKVDGVVIERPQDLFMRVAIQLHIPDEVRGFRNPEVLLKIFKAYDRLSQKFYVHATPTLFNCGTLKPAFSSCYLLGSEDSIEGINKTLTDCSLISKNAGGIGFSASEIRASGSFIRGTNGKSSGLVPFLREFNDAARAWNQGGKRNGSFAVYLEPHHPDIMQFLDLRKNAGDENMRCRDLFLAMWISDLFMERVRDDTIWSLFCPDKCPGLNTSYGEEYRDLYLKYESEGKFQAQLNARHIFEAICESIVESGIPYISYKDNFNRTNMQNNLGVIKCSNLCVSGDTLILTDKGYFPIKQLSEYELPVHKVWNGEIFTDATFAKTGENVELLEIYVSISNNMLDYDKEEIIKCTPYHNFILSNETIVKSKDLKVGDRLYTWYDPKTDSNNYSMIKSITKLEQKEDTYCFNEPLKNRGIFNGILLGNCAEIALYSDSREYSTCNLSSICLPKFVEDSYSAEELELSENERRELNHEFPIHPILNYKLLAEVAGEMVENLNNVIDKNFNPTIEAARSNFNNRPIGVGVQGLADVFLKFKIPFESDNAKEINRKIFEAIYYGAITKSSVLSREFYKSVICHLTNTEIDDDKHDDKHDDEDKHDDDSKKEKKQPEYKHALYPKHVMNDVINKIANPLIKQIDCNTFKLTDKEKSNIRNKIASIIKKENELGVYTDVKDVPKTIGAYPSYFKNGGGHMSEGKFHWEVFGLDESKLSGLFDWESLRMHIAIYGVRNSVVCAAMPTASTSQIMGCSKCFEPYISNVYKRSTLAGEYVVINKYLMHDLYEMGLWNNSIKNHIVLDNGSIQNIEGISQDFKNLYKTVWEVKQKSIIDMSIDRQPFIDQSQSMNLFVEDLSFNKFLALQFHGWNNKLKTGSYYIHTRAASKGQLFTISPEEEREFEIKRLLQDAERNKTLVAIEEEVCLACSS